MIAVVLRGLAQRRLRSVLTALAIVLGVAMISGTYVQTDQIKSAFTDIENTALGKIDVVVTQRTAFDSMMTGAVADFDGSVIDRVRALPGVRGVTGDLFESGTLVRNGKRIGSNYAPNIVMAEAGALFSPNRYVQGRMPRRGEVSVNSKLAADEHLRIGEMLHVATRTGIHDARLAGVFDYGDVGSIGGATMVAAPLADVQEWYRMQGRVTAVDIVADDGVPAADLAQRVRAVVPASLRVRTGRQEATATSKRWNDAIGGFLTPMLLSLAFAAVLVGAFIIFNTFSITVAQRTREFALLRAMGATRRQLLGIVTGEALVIGTGASVVGIFGGLGFAKALSALFDAMGAGIPRAGMELQTRTIVVSLCVGIGASMLASLSPALRATRVSPVLAMAGATEPSARARRWTPWVAALFGLFGAGSLAAGLFAGGPATTRLSGTAGGAVMLFVALAMSARYIVRPVASIVGRPIERFTGEPGRLARENAMRNPARTASTSAALMVGLGLVVFVAVFAAGLKQSVRGSMEDLVHANFIIVAANQEPLPSGAELNIELTSGVGSVGSILLDQIQVNGKKSKMTTDTVEGVDPKGLLGFYRPDWVHGSDATLAHLQPGQALLESSFADAHHLRMGDRFSIRLPSGRGRTVVAAGEYDDPMVLQGMMVTMTDFNRMSANHDPFLYAVNTTPGASVPAVQGALKNALADYPAAKVRTQSQYVDSIVGQFDRMVNLLYALLAMSVVISLFGLANSLILSIHERTREFGLLRAVGATDRQVRRVVRYESVITSVIGGLLGIGVGVLFAALVTAALSDLGLGFSIPVGQLVGFLVLAVIVGIVGAVAPARRGARIDVLEALRHE